MNLFRAGEHPVEDAAHLVVELPGVRVLFQEFPDRVIDALHPCGEALEVGREFKTRGLALEEIVLEPFRRRLVVSAAFLEAHDAPLRELPLDVALDAVLGEERRDVLEDLLLAGRESVEAVDAGVRHEFGREEEVVLEEEVRALVQRRRPVRAFEEGDGQGFGIEAAARGVLGLVEFAVVIC